MPKGIYKRVKRSSTKRKGPKRVTRAGTVEPIEVTPAMPGIPVKVLDAEAIDSQLAEVENVLRAIRDQTKHLDCLAHSAAARCKEIVHDLRNELYPALSRVTENV